VVVLAAAEPVVVLAAAEPVVVLGRDHRGKKWQCIK
jgi:hypothetical protein